MLAVLLARFANAHTLGLSTADFVVGPEGTVQATLVFANGEPIGPPEDFASFIADGVEVTADGSFCRGAFQGAEPDGVDGVRLSSTYACPRGASQIAVTLYYLNAFAQGHREVARIVSEGASQEAILTRDRRSIELSLPVPATSPDERPKRLRRAQAAILAGIAIALAAGLIRGARRSASQRKVRPPDPPAA